METHKLKKMKLFFDTETTGIAPKGAHWESDFEQFPFIVQLSWKRSDQDFVNDFIIKPEGYEIPQEATDVHGISTMKALTEGVKFDEVVNKFLTDVHKAEKVICHNIYFDTSNIKANILKIVKENPKDDIEVVKEYMNEALHKDKRVDTMMKTINFCKIPFKNGRGGYKWPKLEELYDKLFNASFNAHNSKDDVLATERCYNELVSQGII